MSKGICINCGLKTIISKRSEFDVSKMVKYCSNCDAEFDDDGTTIKMKEYTYSAGDDHE